MPRSRWTDKDERMYEKIKRQQRKSGTNMDRAEEIAARTVNKHRREEGRTSRKTTSGTGNPRKSLSERSRDELYNRAKQLHIRGRSKMNKQQLARAVRNAE